MKIFGKLLLCLMCLSLLATAALAEGDLPWYELSSDDCILTLRLPVAEDEQWKYAFSEPAALELLTMETLGDEPGEDAAQKQWVASFMPTNEHFGNVTIECNNGFGGVYSLELFIVENGQMQIVDACAPEELQYAYVLTTGSANIRKEPNIQSESMGVAQEGAQLGWLGETARDNRGMIWFKVSWDEDCPGWVSARYSALMDEELVVEFTGERVNVRNQPSLDGDVVDVFTAGDTALYLNVCKLDERNVVWYSIRTCGGPCWVSSKYAYLR